MDDMNIYLTSVDSELFEKLESIINDWSGEVVTYDDNSIEFMFVNARCLWDWEGSTGFGQIKFIDFDYDMSVDELQDYVTDGMVLRDSMYKAVYEYEG